MGQLSNRSKREQEIYDIGLDRQIWKKFFRNQGHFENQRRLEIFRKFLDVENREVLEIGGSMSKAYVYDNSNKKHSVTCINISDKELAESKRDYSRSQQPLFIQMDAHKLDFDDSSFDMVFGFGMLHHLDYEKTLFEVNRVLKPGGIAIFKEPLDENPVAQLVRFLTPKARTHDEIPFRRHDLEKIKDIFSNVELQFDQLLTFPIALISGLFIRDKDTKFIKVGFNMDNLISRYLPFLRRYFRQVTIVIKKEAE